MGNFFAGLNAMAGRSGDPSGFWLMIFVEAICAVILSAIIAVLVSAISNYKFVDTFKGVFGIIAVIDIIILLFTF